MLTSNSLKGTSVKPWDKKILLLPALLASLISLSTYQPSLTAFAAEGAAQGIVLAVSGFVKIQRQEGKTDSARTGSILKEGDALSTGSSSLAALALDGGPEIRVNADTTLRILGRPGNECQSAMLDKGQIWTRLAHGKGELLVRTSLAVAAVRGTEADVRMDKSMNVKVYEGTVALSNALGQTILEQGQMSGVKSARTPPEPARTMSPRDRETWQNGIRAGSSLKERLLKELRKEIEKPRGSAPPFREKQADGKKGIEGTRTTISPDGKKKETKTIRLGE